MVDKPDKTESSTTNIPNAIPMAIPMAETSKNSMMEEKMSIKNIVIGICIFFIIIIFICISNKNYGDSQDAIQRENILKVLEMNYKINSDKFNLDSVQETRNNFNNRYLSMIEIDLTDCPADFAIAYKEHCDAYKEIIDTLDKIENLNKKYNVGKGIMDGLKIFRGWTGIADQAKSMYELAEDQYDLRAKIARIKYNIPYTYNILLETSSKYSVNIDKYKNIYDSVSE